MRPITLKVHNYRSLADVNLSFESYTLVVGMNNSGKSNLIDAIRTFYDQIKFEESRDVPKFKTVDNESWIEIWYNLNSDEAENIKAEYRCSGDLLKIRRYFRGAKEGVYAYEGHKLSESLFYGAKNVSQGKLGDIIYIPAVSKLDDQTKTSGPSPMRDIVNAILKGISGQSVAYADLTSAFEKFNQVVMTEETDAGLSLEKFADEVSQELNDWNSEFQLVINPMSSDDLVKSLLSHRLMDGVLGQPIDSRYFGQGMQRHLIFTLLRLGAKYLARKVSTSGRKEFAPELTWLLYEEPEAFLHPIQMDVLHYHLLEIADATDTQVLITTHSPQFASKNVSDLTRICRMSREGAVSRLWQLTSSDIRDCFEQNQEDMSKWQRAGIPVSQEDLTVEMESVKYSLWLNPFRVAAFFAARVLIVEGPSETALINYLIDRGNIGRPYNGLFVIDAMGKFNIHRFMNLFGALGIRHAVLMDEDSGVGVHAAVKETIMSSSNEYTMGIVEVERNLEAFLGIPKPERNDKKPQWIMYLVGAGKVEAERLQTFAEMVSELISR